VYACKYDGCHNARLCANARKPDKDMDKHCLHRSPATWPSGIVNAYLGAEKPEKVIIIAEPKFGELEGHTLVIYKVLYGLWSGGLRWSEKFWLCLQDMGFFASLAD
jgi:hypothetical protein